jgi:hypothetical protein
MLKSISAVLAVALVVFLGIKFVGWMNNPWYYIQKPTGTGIFFSGDPEAVPRSDPHWGNQWKVVLLKVEVVSTYFIDFQSGQISMRRLWPVQTRYIVVRLGPSDVTFFATCKKRKTKLQKITDPLTSDEMVEKIRELGIGKDVTWI